MASNDEAERRRRISVKSLILILIVAASIVVAGWALMTVSNESQLPSSAFVTMPNTPLPKTGEGVRFSSVSAIAQKGVAVGVKGYLLTITGQPISGAKVYAQYYLQGAYRTQVTTTDQNGYFQIEFPMNWTGWLPVTLAYFGDSQHQGLKALFSVSGENL